MKFATFEHRGAVQAGVVSDSGAKAQVHPLPSGTGVIDLVCAGLPVALAAGTAALAGPGVPVDQVRLLPPLNPPTVRDFVTFEEHVEGVVASVGDGTGVVPEWYQAPTFYFTNPYALIGAHDEVATPAGCTLFDYELEVAAIVGSAGGSLAPDQVDIFGYTIMNDWSARDCSAGR
jgi:2-keto-4-pentenoate hydratase/2-oxohepta-3-ene-1,7-dioic acid hydratase in catechol pathway